MFLRLLITVRCIQAGHHVSKVADMKINPILIKGKGIFSNPCRNDALKSLQIIRHMRLNQLIHHLVHLRATRNNIA